MNKHVRVMLATLLIMTAILILLPSGYIGAAGMVVNGGFEEGGGGVPTAWNVTGNATRVDTGPVHVGNWSARITGQNDTLIQWLYLGNITFPITYEAWGWIYVSGNVTGVIGFDFWGGNEVTQLTQLSPTTMLSATDTNGTYVQRSSVVQAPICTTYLRISLQGTDWNEGAEVRFDEIGFYYLGFGMGYCFIATAAYGTETAAELNVLRDFRDQVLLKSALGSRFVDAYYKISPPIADFIAKNDFLRTVVRELLIDPVVDLLQWSGSLWRA
jgi:hypothetical protein